MVTGIDDEVTLRANRESFLKFQLRPRRLVDLGHDRHNDRDPRYHVRQPHRDRADCSNRAFHPDGEVAVANAAKTGNHCKYSHPARRRRSTRRSQHAARLCGSSCTRGVGRSPKPFSEEQNGPDPSWRSSRSTEYAHQLGNARSAAAHRQTAVQRLPRHKHSGLFHPKAEFRRH